MKQTLASGVIPQITAILGSCGGGLALFPTLTDFTFMEKKNAKLFVNAPNALDGNNIAKCDSSSAEFQSQESGIVDVMEDEAAVLTKIRELIDFLPSNNAEGSDMVECTDDLNRVNPELANCVGDTSIALSVLADNNDFYEVKADYAKDMVVGFLKLDGVTIGAVANRSEVCDEEGKTAEKLDAVLTVKGCEKAADFVSFCDAFDIPVLTLTNVKGYEATVLFREKYCKSCGKAYIRICQRNRSQGKRGHRQGSGNRGNRYELKSNRCRYYHGMARCGNRNHGRKTGCKNYV